MDPLSDLLRHVHLDGAYFFGVDAAKPWTVESPRATEIKPRILPGAEHLINYHIVAEGRCFGGLLDEPMVELSPGDVLVFPHGDPHLISSEPSRPKGSEIHRAGAAPHRMGVVLGDPAACDTRLICGYLGCDRGPFNPLLAALPRRMHMRGASSPWLGNFTSQLTEESNSGRAGADCVLTRLAELMFIDVLRRYLDELPAGQTGWLAALRDDVVSRALALIHARPGHSWTLAELARESASSRSSLAKRFTDVVGQPPMQYLAQWRMQLAATLLVQSAAKVAAIGVEVGYDSEAAFSRAFKKATQMAPGAWRAARHGAQQSDS